MVSLSPECLCRLSADMAMTPNLRYLVHMEREVDRMRVKMTSVNWRHLLYSGATLATLLVAAGARWKPN